MVLNRLEFFTHGSTLFENRHICTHPYHRHLKRPIKTRFELHYYGPKHDIVGLKVWNDLEFKQNPDDYAYPSNKKGIGQWLEKFFRAHGSCRWSKEFRYDHYYLGGSPLEDNLPFNVCVERNIGGLDWPTEWERHCHG